jgi:ATP-dependent Clp protease ATP-binding subunit ClpA
MTGGDGPSLAPDTAMVLGIAATAMPFARTTEAEAERWLWVLRIHGDSGVALQALGVGEASLEAPHDDPAQHRPDHGKDEEKGAIGLVTQRAARLARQRGSEAVETTDVLVAVMDVYGEEFDRVLQAHGTDRREVLERLAAQKYAYREG